MAVSEAAIEAGLRAGIASGDIAARINETLGKWLVVPTVVVDRGRVTIDASAIDVTLDCRAIDACPFFVDLNFRATVHLVPEVVGRKLWLRSDGIDVNLDNTDAVYCLLAGALAPPGGLLFTGITLGIAAFYTTPFNKTVPGSWQGKRLPGTELYPYVELRAGGDRAGHLDASGALHLVPDDVNAFVYVQVVRLEGPSGKVVPVSGARVELLELGSPQPVGDDFVVPEDWSVTKTVRWRETTRSMDYRAQPDIVLTGASTERHGLAQLATGPLSRTGYLSTFVETVVDTRDSEVISQRWEHDSHGGDAPDLALRITLPDGSKPIERQLISLNFQGRVMGTMQDPVRVVFPPTFAWPAPDPEPNRCEAEAAKVRSAETALEALDFEVEQLQAELGHASPAEKRAILAEIRRIRAQRIPDAQEALSAAELALDRCCASGGPRRNAIPLVAEPSSALRPPMNSAERRTRGLHVSANYKARGPSTTSQVPRSCMGLASN